jgi:gliding motility-associated-like protein
MLLLSITKASAQTAMPDTVCIGTVRQYKVNDATVPSTYVWMINGVTQSSNKNTFSVTWNNAGTFTVTVQEYAATGCPGDLRTGIVVVKPFPIPNAGPDATICFGSSYQLKGSGGILYQWTPPSFLSNTNIPNPVVNVPGAGTYRYVLNVTDANGCTSNTKDTIVLTVLPEAKIFAGNDTSIAINQPLQLNAVDVNGSNFNSYNWSPSFGLNNAFIKDPLSITNRDVTYIVTARNAAGCVATDDIKVRVFQGPELYVPNAFTPNGDGLNDVIRPICAGIRELKRFSVFNRYGQMVFTTTKVGEGWNGIFLGEKQNAGAFTWIAEAIDYKGNVINRKGIAILIR